MFARFMHAKVRRRCRTRRTYDGNVYTRRRRVRAHVRVRVVHTCILRAYYYVHA